MSAYLILGGTTRAATSALFAHLAHHPGLAPARLKEPRFFLDPDYPLPTAFPFARGLAAYEALFPPGAERLRLEATPDYLHSPGTAARIAATLADVRLVFSLRDPSARLVSWYRYARAAGRLPPGLSLAEFVARSRAEAGGEQPFRALHQGRYAADLERFLAALGAARVHVLFQEELVADPPRVLGALAAFAGLDPAPLARPFERENAARETRSAGLHRRYVRLGFRLRNACADRPRLFALLRAAHRLAKPVYALANVKPAAPLELEPRLRAELDEFYAPSVEQLERLLGRPVPWPAFRGGAGSAPAAAPAGRGPAAALPRPTAGRAERNSHAP